MDGKLKVTQTPSHTVDSTANTDQPRSYDGYWLNPILYEIVTRSSLAWFFGPCRGKIYGLENVLPLLNSKSMIVPNHVSYLDWMVICAYFQHHHGGQPITMAKEKLFSHWLWGPVITHGHGLRVADDGSSILDRTGYRKFRDARLTLIFPEGTRSENGKVGETHLGAVKLAARLQVPMLPTTLNGFYDAWPRNRKLPRPRPCSITFGKPYSVPKECAHDDEAARFHTDAIVKIISEGLG